jgi:hypothetical protein
MGGAANGPATVSFDGARRRQAELEQDDEDILSALAVLLPRILR